MPCNDVCVGRPSAAGPSISLRFPMLFVLLGCHTLLAQSDEPVADLKAEVARLVTLLDADQLATRQAAEESLIELGPAAMEFFPMVTARTPAEVKERLGRVKGVFEKAIAAAAREPSRISLQGEFSLPDALAALEKQSGNRVVGYERRSGTVDVDFQDIPYWEAIDRLLDQVDLNIDAFGGEAGALVLSARADGELPRFGKATYQGGFRFEPQRIDTRRDLRNPSINGMNLSLGVSWEPRIRPISMQQQLADIKVIDDRGEEIDVNTERRVLNARAETGMSAVDMNVPLSLPSRQASKIASLKGTLTAVVPGGMEEFEFTDLAQSRDVEQQKAGVTVVFERLRKNQDLYELRIRVRFEDAGEALQSHFGWIYENEAFLVNPKGTRFENLTFNTDRQDEAEIIVTYLFSLPDKPDGYKFVYRTPASILRLRVNYEVKDIELP